MVGAFVLVAWHGPVAHAKAPDPADVRAAKSFFKAADAGKWQTARRYIGRAKDPVVATALRWTWLVAPNSGATFDEVAEQYPQVSTGYDHIDAACIHFVERPERYDVIVTDNLFGDILTDLGGAVAGGVGYAASANLNPARTGPSMFEPVHGTAPDIAGQNKANPIAAIISLQLMLDFLGEADAAAAVAAACDNPERYTGSTTDIGDAVAAAVRSA